MKITWILWLLWYAYWIISARKRIRGTAENETKRESLAGRWAYMALLIAGFALLIWRTPWTVLQKQLWPVSTTWQVAGAGIQAAGLGFAVWARRTLGKNWTGRITTGGSQDLVVRGPYRLVRHPIYTGVLLGILGTAIQIAEVRAVLGFLMLLVGILVKLGREEAALREHFGSAYEDYSGRVPRLLPGF